MPAVVASMTSTPTSQATIMEQSTADKKRNKLGYHRTSVACVHCRRRKIRCLVATDDVQGRCENCIRLRKECQFFPVDQQPPIERKSRPNSRLETASTDPSTASSSPPTVSGGEQTEAFFPYQPIPLSSGQDVAAFNNGAFAGSSMASYTPDATQSIDPPVPWDEFTTISDPQMLANMSAAGKPMMNMPAGVWNQAPNHMAGMPPNASLPGAPTVPSQSHAISAAPPYTVQPDGSVWQVPPSRSMTFPAQPDLTVPFANPGAFPQPMATDLKRRMTSPPQHFPPAHVNPQSPPPADLQGAPVSVSYPGQPAAMGYPAWQDVNGMASMNMVQYPMYAADAAQQAAFGSPPMGHQGPGQSPGS